MKRQLLALSLLALSLGACSDSTPPPPAQPAAAEKSSAAKGGEITAENQGVLTDTQAKALNEANQVNATLQAADEARRKQLETQTQ